MSSPKILDQQEIVRNIFFFKSKRLKTTAKNAGKLPYQPITNIHFQNSSVVIDVLTLTSIQAKPLSE